MHYDPIKELLGRFFNRSPLLRKSFYSMLNILLLRTWHVHKALRNNTDKSLQELNILDAGMGFGQYSWWMVCRYPRAVITAADIKREQVEDCNRFFRECGVSGRVNAIEANLVEYNRPAEYNLILCVDVMEHILDDRKVFENFFSSLKPGGRLIISTPSDKGGSDVHDDHQESFIGEHVRDGYSIEDISSKLADAGFSRVKADYTYGRPGSIAWRLSMKYPVMMLSFSKIMFVILPFYYIVVMPFALVLNCLDLFMRHRQGTGLIVIAGK